MPFPTKRMRRLRQNENFQQLVRETVLTPQDLILPLFVMDGIGVKEPIESLPGQYRLSPDEIVKMAREAVLHHIPAVILFGIPAKKDPVGSGAYAADGIVQKAIVEIKSALPDLLVITDVCLCEYTDHGHCGVVAGQKVDNDATLSLLAQTALSHAAAGADMVAPSDMMDGRVGAIRVALDDDGFTDTSIMAYAAKYCSAYYGPFRSAVDSAPRFGDRRSYQMDPANSNEALQEVSLDINEGADIVMVKPALAFLDIIWRVKNAFDCPVAAYNVSGEYAMIKAAGRLGWLDEQKVTMETLTSIKRAGADMILTYFALYAAKIIND